MKNMRTKTAQLITLSLTLMITLVGLMMPQGAIAQKTESHAQYVPAELEGFSAATTRSSIDATQLKETLAQDSKNNEASRPDTSQMTAPANDMFANAQLLSGTIGSVTGTNVQATLEPTEPAANITNKTVWYKWTAPSNLSMSFETVDGFTMSDTFLGVFTGSALNNLTTIALNDDINYATSNFRSRVTFIANAGTTYYIQVRGFDSGAGTFSIKRQINQAETTKQFNYDGAAGSNASDYAVFRPSSASWYIHLSASGSLLAQPWGTNQDFLHSGDFDGDGSTDIAVWRPSTGTFYVLSSHNGSLLAVQWGQSGDFPVQGDFDGDDISDFAVFRPINGTFYVRKSTDGQLLFKQFGQNGDYPACGDYDGDGITDFGIQRQVVNDGVFYILRSSDGQVFGQQFGLFSDNIVPGDYDGDGKNDIAVYRSSTNGFYALRSTDGGLFAVKWGASGDIIAPGDYIGDSKTDVTVFRPSTGAFYTFNADTNGLTVMPWGTQDDVPIPRSNVH